MQDRFYILYSIKSLLDECVNHNFNKLIKWNLRGNQIDPDGITEMCIHLSRLFPNAQIEDIDISQNPLLSKEDEKQIKKSIRKLKKVSHFIKTDFCLTCMFLFMNYSLSCTLV